MIHLDTHWPVIAVLAVASGALACGGDDGDGNVAGPGGSTSSDGSTSPTGTTEPGGTCTADALFEPQSFGEDGTDLIRRIALDSQTGDIIFSVWQQIYRLPAGSGAPELLMDRPPDAQPVYGAFWLVDNDILMPAAPGIGSIITAAVPGASMDLVPVLYKAPRAGGEATLEVSALMPSEEQVFYQIAGARVVGDEVFWVDIRNERESFSTGSPIDRIYRAWRTNWRTPAAEPDLLYTSELDLDVPVVVNGVAYIEEANSDSAQDGSRQRMIQLADGTVAPSSAEETYGGRVIAGDDQSLIVYNEDVDFERIEDYGVYRVALDGTEEEQLYQGFTQLDWRSNAGSWAYDVFNIDADTKDIYHYQPGSAPRLLGCVDGSTTVHDVVVGADAVYASVFYADLKATILRFPL